MHECVNLRMYVHAEVYFPLSPPLLFPHLACCSEAQDREENCFS